MMVNSRTPIAQLKHLIHPCSREKTSPSLPPFCIMFGTNSGPTKITSMAAPAGNEWDCSAASHEAQYKKGFPEWTHKTIVHFRRRKPSPQRFLSPKSQLSRKGIYDLDTLWSDFLLLEKLLKLENR